MASLSAVRIASKAQPAEKALIVFHGLGDSGHGWSFLADYLQRDPAFKNTRFLFPNAPTIPISCCSNMPISGWFDLLDMSFSQERADVECTLKSVRTVQAFVQEQIDAGVQPENIVIGGFSQGAALALASSALLPYKIGGFFCLSGFCQIQSRIMQLKNNSNLETPIFQGHGDEDPVVPFSKGQEAYEFFTREIGSKNHEFHVYRGMEHSSCPQELQEVIQFIKTNLNANS